MSCFHPFYVDNPLFPHASAERQVPVPCGKCPDCLKRRSTQWSFRMLEEAKVSTSAHFVTFTYDTNTVPITSNGFMTLNKSDFQYFMKRLRSLIKYKGLVSSVRYYACGEYGSTTLRPHYHAILFNVPDILLVEQSWDKGAIHVGEVSDASIQYTVKYMNKPAQIPLHSRDDRQKEFSLMSQGLGKNFLSESVKRYYSDDVTRAYVTLPGGHKVAMPRYFKDKLFSKDDRVKQSIYFRKLAENIQLQKEADWLQTHDSLYGMDYDNVQSKLNLIDNFKRQQSANRKKI